MTLVIGCYPHLEGLGTADQSLIDNPAVDVDILIGPDHYFEIVIGAIRRGDKGPVAVQSEFGWLVSDSSLLLPGKQSILLPPRHHFTDLVILEHH